MASAAKRANLDSYAVEEYQKEGTLLEELMKEMGMEVQLRQNPLVDTTWKQVQYLLSLTDAKGIYARMPYDLIIH